MSGSSKVTAAQRAGNSAPFNRSLRTRAQVAAHKKWVLDGEMSAEELLEQQRRLRAESRIAREQLGGGAAA